jgi:hypothetical protein
MALSVTHFWASILHEVFRAQRKKLRVLIDVFQYQILCSLYRGRHLRRRINPPLQYEHDLTISMEPNPLWESTSRSATKEFLNTLWNPKFLFRVHWSQSWARWIHSILIGHISLRLILILYDMRLSQRWLWTMSSSGMWRCVEFGLTDVSEERIASIFRVEWSASGEQVWAAGCRLQSAQKSWQYYELKCRYSVFQKSSNHSCNNCGFLPGHIVLLGFVSRILFLQTITGVLSSNPSLQFLYSLPFRLSMLYGLSYLQVFKRINYYWLTMSYAGHSGRAV